MKMKLLGFMLTLISFPLLMKGQVTLINTSTGSTFSAALICSGAAVDNPKVRLTVSNLSPAVGSGSAISLAIIQRNSSGNIIATTTLPDATVFSPQNVSTTIMWAMEIGNTGIIDTVTPNGGGGAGFDPFNRRDGTFQFRGNYQDASGVPHEFFSTSFTIIEGNFPQMQITAANASVTAASWFNNNKFTVLKGCVSNDPRLRVRPDQCGTDGFRIIAREIDNTGAFIGPEINRLLNSTDLAALKTSAGVALNGLTDGTNTLTLATNKLYMVELVYVGQGQWKETFGAMKYKEGTWDLSMRDNASDDGFEPLDKWDDNVFSSADLWNKLSNTINPGTIAHETPTMATIPGNSNKMLVKVTNTGCSTSTAGIPLRLFWTRARTDELWNSHWLYDTLTNFVTHTAFPSRNLPAGSEITINGATMSDPYNATSTPFLLPAINAGASYQMPFSSAVDWFPPNPAWYDAANGSMTGTGHPVICLLARINEKTTTLDPISWEPLVPNNKILPYVKNNNNVVTRNTHLVVQSGFLVKPNTTDWHYGFGTVLVNNPTTTPRTVRLCVDLIPDGVTTGTFTTYGTIDIGVTNGLYNAWLAGGSQTINVTAASPTLFTVTSGTHACLENITLAPGFSEQVGLRFNYNNATLPTAPLQYIYQLSQSSGSGEAIEYGSHTTYITDVPTEAPAPQYKTSPTTVHNVTSDGELHLYPNPTENHLNIHWNINEFNPEKVEVYDIAGKLVIRQEVKEKANTIRIDLTKIVAGAYIVKIANAEGIIKQSRFVKN